MKLLTKELIEKFEKYPLYSQDGKGGDATVIARFYIPRQYCSNGEYNWIITEGNIIKDANGNIEDVEMFGYACLNGDIQNSELGYIILSELEDVNQNYTIPIIEQDKSFNENINLRDALQKTLHYVPEFLQQPVKYEIYQLKDTDENHFLRFAPLGYLKNGVADIKGTNYYQVYSAEYENGVDMSDASERYYALENLFRNFNGAEEPLGYIGHSLSVSDIVVLKQGSNQQAYYVDGFGYKELPSRVIDELDAGKSEQLAGQLVDFMKDYDTYEYFDNMELSDKDVDIIDNLETKLNDMSFCESVINALADYMSEASIEPSDNDLTDALRQENEIKTNTITYLENMLNEHMENLEKEQEFDIEKD